MSIVHIHSRELHALLDTGGTPNVLSPRDVKKLSLSPAGTSKMVTMATRAKKGAVGKLAIAPVMFEDLQVELDFIILKSVPLDAVIGRPNIKRLGGVLEFPPKIVRFNYRGQTAVLPMLPCCLST